MEKVKTNPYILTEPESIYNKKGKWSDFFKNTSDIILEIGTGMGNTFSYEIEANPNANLIGMEIKYKRLERTCEKALKVGGKNFVLLKEYGENIDKIFAKDELSKTIIFFPDPWDKKEYQKKHKLLSSEFLQTLHNLTKTGGKVFFKTDHKDYFDEVLEIVTSLNLWKIELSSYDYENETHHFDKTKVTEFEAIYRGENKKICFLELKKEEA